LSVPMPIGETTPKPVITMRFFIRGLEKNPGR
jgi:hypothetical protein